MPDVSSPPPLAARSDRASVRGWPIGTVVVAILALAVHFLPAWRDDVFYLRDAIFAGDVWRLWSGHLVHFSTSHLIWNLAILVPAGAWLERIDPKAARVFYLLSPPLIGLLMLMFDPSLLRYGGLSGLATGVLVLLAVLQLVRRDPREPVWFWLGVLALVAGKLILEQVSGAPLLVSDLGNVRVVPWAHLGGLICAVLACVWRYPAARRYRRGIGD